MNLLTRTRERHVAHSIIADPELHTTMDPSGFVRSVQAANIDMPEPELDAIWSPMHLERLARTYWKYLSRVTLGLIRVEYTPADRAVVFVARPFVLLRFSAPEYETSRDGGVVRWPIRDGLLVAVRDYGHLEIRVLRCPSPRPGYARVHVEVEVANFSPSIGRLIGRWVYTHTQARIHVIVTHGFLKSLAKLELEESAVGRFADGGGPTAGQPNVKVGDTPWRAVAGIAAAAALVAAALVHRLRR